MLWFILITAGLAVLIFAACFLAVRRFMGKPVASLLAIALTVIVLLILGEIFIDASGHF
jgi:hypothetical protein